MAKFRVIEQIGPPKQIAAGQYSFSARAKLLDGRVEAGMKFRGNETHHAVDFTIRTVTDESEQIILIDCVSAWKLYEGFLDGAYVDTDGTTRGVHFFWDHDQKFA